MQGFNMGRYVPPDQEGVTSANKLAGKHPLGSRARNLHSTGALTVRFEMPFAIWCSTCKPPEKSTAAGGDSDPDHVLIGQGVRFNAEKKRVGNYHSTPIWSFRMKHAVCGGWIEIRTDPKNAEYVVVEGGRRRATTRDGEGEGREGPLALWVEEGSSEIKMGNKEGDATGDEPDPFTKFEKEVEDERGFMTARGRIEALRKRQDRNWEDPYGASRKLRKGFRAERKDREAAQGRADELRDKMSLGIELKEEEEIDRVRAGLVDFGPTGDLATAMMRTKGLFEPSSSDQRELRTTESGKKEGRKKHPKKKTAADISLDRKNLLQQQLSGNTRAAVDPFLSDDKVWRPGFNVKRKAGTADGTSPARRLCSDDGQIDASKRQPEALHAGDSGAVDVATQPRHPTALVHYGSDSE